MALTKAVIVKLDATDSRLIPVMFNPPRYELAKTSRFTEIKVPGLPSAVLQYVGGDVGTLTMELFFDTTDQVPTRDVRVHTSLVTALTEPNAVTGAPPRLLMLWGSLAFPCFLVSVRQAFDYFNSAGIPLRATLTVEFKGFDPVASVAAPLAAAEQVTRYVAKVGETLAGIAAAVYGDPAQWRRIASANGIDDPRTVTAGRPLQIPRLP